MRKFTTLKEDIIKENAQVQKEFDSELQAALEKLDKIKTELDALKVEYMKNPGNWGFVGTLGHVNEELDDILEFIEVPKPPPDRVWNQKPGIFGKIEISEPPK